MLGFRTMKQLSFFKSKHPLFYGGALVGKRKARRPLCSKRPLHIVLKARKRNLYAQKIFLEMEMERHAKQYSLKIYSRAVNADHIHLLVKISNRENYKSFIRALTGYLAKAMGKGIWSLLPFTRVLSWGCDFHSALQYLRKNREEVCGMRPYEKRREWYGKFLSPITQRT